MAFHRPLRIVIVQFAPNIGEVHNNISKAEQLCSSIAPGSVDLVCLPEMIFSGYVFDCPKAIVPHLEDPQNGPTSRFCQSLAQRLRCHVIAGYPERLRLAEESQKYEGDDASRVGYNSSVLYGPGGNYVGGYRKTNLFETDMSWALPGEGFKTFRLPPPLGALTVGICMDLNPAPGRTWNFRDGPFEIASYCLTKTADKPRTKVLVLLNAWLDSNKDMDAPWDLDTVNYWMARLKPLWEENANEESKEDALDQAEVLPPEDVQETVVIVCNRGGLENGILFAGTSTIFKFAQGSGRPDIVGIMRRREEGVKLWTVW